MSSNAWICDPDVWFYEGRVSICHLDYFYGASSLAWSLLLIIQLYRWYHQQQSPVAHPSTAVGSSAHPVSTQMVNGEESPSTEEVDEEQTRLPHIPHVERAVLIQLVCGLLMIFTYTAQFSIVSYFIQGWNWYSMSHLLATLAWIMQLEYQLLSRSFFAHLFESKGFQQKLWLQMHSSTSVLMLWLFSAVCFLLRIISSVQIFVNPTAQDPNLYSEFRLVEVILDAVQLTLIVIVLLSQWVRQYAALSHGYSLLASNDNSTARTAQGSAFSFFWVKMRRLLPFMWPRGDRRLQFAIFCTVSLLIFNRFVNVLLPLSYKNVVDALTHGGSNSSPPQFPIKEVLFFVGLQFLQGSSGLVSTLQSTFWIPIEQFTTRSVSLQMFEHLHRLSLRYHLNRKTGEVLRVMDRGTQAISSLVSYIWFNIVPVLVDILLAIIYFVYLFDMYFGIIVFTTMAFYLWVTVAITEWRTKYRRTMIELDNSTNAKAVDSLLNFETVKYYGNEDFEIQNYGECIRKYQKADWTSQLSLKLLNSMQNFVITVGLLAGGLLCVKRVVDGVLRVGDFVMFITYLQQLYQPLNWFGTYYRMINQNFIDMEKMLDLFKENPEIKDDPNAKELQVSTGSIRFENITFTYEPAKASRPSLDSISFDIPAGQTVALVGPSGGGKSSIFRLLFRFYDTQQGRILIDGQDIREVTQRSLRQAIGVVPQDTVLFNDTIEYNIRYGNVKATDTDIKEAAQLAQIHERIMSFPDGYQTLVGERGLRLSGGEKQRVAIARTLLKQPKIVLLDEATSALDTTTERQMQKALNGITKDRTTLVIAHRLSTIVGADQIVVVNEGRIVERGTHEELLALGEKGMYHELWYKQLEKEGAPPPAE